ncbi:hypothetical protein ACLMJK_003298 [Lecanora helva]
MSEIQSTQQAEKSSNNHDTSPHGPSERSRYVRNEEMNEIMKPSEMFVEAWREKRPVYHKGPRGGNPKPFTIREVLGNGQYTLEQDGKCDGKIYLEEDLSTEPW